MSDEKYYSLEEVSNELKVAYLTVYRWVQDGKLPAHQVGKQYRIAKQDFDAFIDSRKKNTTSPTLQELNKDQLISMVKQLKRQKKFGLIWEDKPEAVAEKCKKELPVLEQDEQKKILADKDGPTNLLIEGDNYHSLSVLNYTHSGKIDAIYADPPYNTGAKNWIYNNDYVDGNDRFRHSKWLSFMEKRLRLAKSLLKEEGIIVVTIDDYEVATLTLLMSDIFGEENHLGTVVIKSNPSGRSTTSGFALSHEYALFYAKSSSAKIGRLQRDDKQIARYKEVDDIGNFEWVNFRARYSTISPRLQYPIFVKKDASGFRIPTLDWDTAARQYKLTEKPEKDEVIKYPMDSSNKLRCWKWSIDTVKKSQKTEMAVRLDSNKEPSVYAKARMKDEGMLPLTWWDKTEYSATAYGTNLLNKILSDSSHFDYPKSLYAVMDTLRVLTDNKSALILDFFAGSGTTGHAVALLNREDGGSRQFILCSNNEGGIAEDVTYPRIKKVAEGVQGLSELTGIPINLRYFKTAFVKKSSVSDDTRLDLVRRSAEMICVRENTFEKVNDKPAYKIYRDNDHVTGILFDLDSIEAFKSELAKQNIPAHIYVFSLSNDTYDDDFADLGLEHELCPIPESILEVYRKLFRSKKR